MKITGEGIKIDPTPVDEGGSKIEPEERSAIEAMQVPVETHLSDHAVKPGEAVADGSMRGVIGHERGAGEVAQDVSTRCNLCEHWRREDYVRHLERLAETKDGQDQISKLRGMLLGLATPSQAEDEDAPESDTITTTGSIDPNDLIAVNIAIRNEFAICAAFTESMGQPTITPYYGGCPLDDARFKVRDRTTKVVASSRYDAIMRLAQGRKE